MSLRQITLACEAYDRMRGLRDGSVPVRGVDLNFLPLPVEETFYRMLRFREFEAAEMSLSSYVLTLPDGPFVALPVFPSRVFRHSAIYVREDSELTDPADLAGRLVGVPEYQITAAVWIRGILKDHHGLDPFSVHYRTGGLDSPGRPEKVNLNLPPNIDVQRIPEDRTLSAMLLDGELDAVYSARNPGPFNTPGHGGLRRLFKNPTEVERQYVRETGIFPIMHTLVLRRDVYESAPWIAQELLRACTISKSIAAAELAETASLSCMLPWAADHQQTTIDVLGDDWWPYGLEANEPTLRAFLRYSHEQGLASELFEPRSLFVPETLEHFVI
jgi:4,5-dihydroxyphthalate decarboxylase